MKPPLPSDATGRANAIAAITWEYQRGSQTLTGQGGEFEIGEPWTTGTHVAVMTDGTGRKRRVEIEILAESDRIIVACANVAHSTDLGPRQVQGNSEGPAVPSAVIGTYDLAEFHQRGDHVAASAPAAIQDRALTIPPGALADVTLLDPGEAAQHHVLSLIRVRMDFDYSSEFPIWGQDQDIPERLEARSVEFCSVAPNPLQPGLDDDEAVDPGRRRTLVPGSD